MVISKKKKGSSPRIDLAFPTFRPNFMRITKHHLRLTETISAIFEGGRGNCLIRLTQYPPLLVRLCPSGISPVQIWQPWYNQLNATFLLRDYFLQHSRGSVSYISISDKHFSDRDYDPNKHCGVITEPNNTHCTRSLTCKNHARSLKRKVSGEKPNRLIFIHLFV